MHKTVVQSAIKIRQDKGVVQTFFYSYSPLKTQKIRLNKINTK